MTRRPWPPIDGVGINAAHPAASFWPAAAGSGERGEVRSGRGRARHAGGVPEPGALGAEPAGLRRDGVGRAARVGEALGSEATFCRGV